jgi:very-short-patch-repair endonuclease
MEIFNCKHCGRDFEGYTSFRKHMSMSHKVKSEDIFIEYKLNGIVPTCECGCGEKPKFLSETAGFRRFVNGHNSATSENNFHKDPETKIKSAKTQSENWKKGMYRRWWDEDTDETREKIEGIKEKLRNDKERGDKISKALSGTKKSEEHKEKLSESAKNRYKNNPELKTKMSEIRLRWMRDNSKVKTSKLEDKFELFLIMLNLKVDIDYHKCYLVESIKTFFDFYFINKNIIIEVDGDFYHCNPNTQHAEPKYPIQVKNLSNDKRKNTWAKNRNIPLYRFWEKDINERPEWVLGELKKLLC